MIIIAAFAIAAIVTLAAPLMAISWSHQPFPGFLIEQTLVVVEVYDDSWTGRPAGLQAPQRVTRIGGFGVETTSEFNAVITSRSVGDQVPILTISPDGSTHLFPSVTLREFSSENMFRMFWLPYLVGLVYLAIGAWIYQARGTTAPGRYLAVFSVNAAIVCMLLFDTRTTHAASAIWTVALAQVGGASINLGLHFPEERKVAGRHAWMLGLPHAVSIALAIWGLLVLNRTSAPWDYFAAWGASMRYAAIGLITFLGLTLYSARPRNALVMRRQARIVLWGAFIGFAPVSLRFLVPLFNYSWPIDDAVLFPGLLIFPLTVALAILRYRLQEADTIVNRTIVYGVLTAFLAGVFTAAIALSQRLFSAITGERSDAAIIVTTLIVASAVAPLKKRLDAFVNKQFAQPTDSTQGIRDFGARVRAFTRMRDAEQIAAQLLEEAVASLRAQSGAVNLIDNGQLKTVATFGRWTGEVWLSVPIEERGIRYGLLFLGPREEGRRYQPEELQALQAAAAEVARAVRLALTPPTGIDFPQIVARDPDHAPTEGQPQRSPWKSQTGN